MTVNVRLFAVLRERAGTDRIALQLPEEATVADALVALSRVPALAGLLERLPVQMAVNRDYAELQTRLNKNDELALIPPISGGSQPRVAVTERQLDMAALAATVAAPSAGAIVTFAGVTRRVSRLDYEAYREMATRRIRLIVGECVEKHGLCAASAEHRVGPVALGEPSVIVAVSAPHRAEAFAGAGEIIDRIKAEVPIWKVEIDSDGTPRRVTGTPAPGPDARDRAEPAVAPRRAVR
jgi:MoaE-MoaD fusion protein